MNIGGGKNVRRESLEIISKLQSSKNEKDIETAIDFIEELVDKYYDLKEELKQLEEDFAEYRKYGRCYDEDERY